MRRLAYAWLATLAGCGNADPPAPTGDPGPLPISKLMDPETCKDCHPKHYQEWSGSMHAYATDDPLFVVMNERGVRDARIGPFCIKCHAPMAVRTGMTRNGVIDPATPKMLRGVTCYFCHNVDGVVGERNNTLHLAHDAIMRGGYTDPVSTSAHPSAYSPLLDRERIESADMCGSCHDVVNIHDAHLERTYAEWKATEFSTTTACGSCHMSSKEGPIAEGAGVTGVVVPRRIHGHEFPAVDLAIVEWPELAAQRSAVQELLDRTLRTALCVRGDAASASSLMLVVQSMTGHKWPSGAAQHRRLWFELAAYKGDDLIYQSGAVPVGEAPVALADPDLWLVRDCMLDGAGKETHAMWDAVSFESNQLPGLLTQDRQNRNTAKTLVWQSFPRAPGALPAYPDRVTMRVRLQPFALDLFDDLFDDPAAGAFTPEQVGAMRAKLANPLTVGHELEWTLAGADDITAGGHTFFEVSGTPVKCVSRTALDAGADKVPAPGHATCKP